MGDVLALRAVAVAIAFAVVACATAAGGASAARADVPTDNDIWNNDAWSDSDAAGLPFEAAIRATAAPRRPCGSAADGAFDIDVVSHDLSGINDSQLLGGSSGPRLFAVGDADGTVYPNRPPIVLVHGIFGQPSNLQAEADRLVQSGRYQVYVLAYHVESRSVAENASGFADALEHLETVSPGARAAGVTIVAHSMGGIVSRATLNTLATRRPQTRLTQGRIRLIALDTPWQGYPGPADKSVLGVLSAPARPFIPAGILDMRAASPLFQDLTHVILPENMTINLFFADGSAQTPHVGQGAFKDFAHAVVEHYARDDDMSRDPKTWNYWRALVSSDQFQAFDREMEARSVAGTLDDAAAKALLESHFPSFAGDHTGVLANPKLVDAIMPLMP